MRDRYLWYLSSGKTPVFPGDAYQRYTSLFVRVDQTSRFNRRSAAPGPRLNSHAETSPPGFSAYLAHARKAAPEAALTALNPDGPLAGKGFMGDVGA